MSKRKLGKYEKLLQEWVAADMAAKTTVTAHAGDFAQWLDKRRKSKWIKNTGVMPDLPKGTKVKIKLRDGEKEVNQFNHFVWRIDDSNDDIMEYKVVK